MEITATQLIIDMWGTGMFIVMAVAYTISATIRLTYDFAK